MSWAVVALHGTSAVICDIATGEGRDRGVNISAIDLFEHLAIMCLCACM